MSLARHMASPYRCPGCHRTLSRHAGALRGLPRTSKATFISFRPKDPAQTSVNEDAAPANTDSSTSSAQPRTPSDPRPSSVPPSQSSPSGSSVLSSLFGVNGPSGRYSRPHAAGQALDSVQENRPLRQANASRPNAPHNAAITVKLDAILEKDPTNTKGAWQYFQRHYTSPDCPALKTPAYVDVHRLITGAQFARLQRSIIHKWCAGELERSVPGPVELVQRFIHLGIMRPEIWHEALWLLTTEALVKLSVADQPGPSVAEIMTEVMALWDLLFETSSARPSAAQDPPSRQAETSTSVWPVLGVPWSTVRTMSRSHRFFGTRFNQFLPSQAPASATRLSYWALVAFDILTRDGAESALGEQLLKKSTPFVVFIAHLIPGATRLPLRKEDHETNVLIHLLTERKVPEQEIEAFTRRITDCAGKCMAIIGSYAGSSGGAAEGHHQEPAAIDGEVKSSNEALGDFYYRRIARAYSQQKRLILYDLWLEAHKMLSMQKEKAAGPPVPPRVYNLTMEALLAMRLQEQAIKVWNQMIQDGVVPDILTWTAMIDGCGKAKDVDGMEQMWEKMLHSGIRPDLYAWSARISGMMRARRVQQGLEALDEMAKIWADAYKRAQPAAKRGRQPNPADLPPKPNTVILNGAFIALAQDPIRNQRFIGRLLAWARSLDIQPDVVTYNSLLSLSFNAGNTADAMNLLRQMEARNVSPDAATFSIILNAMFRSESVSRLSREEQNRKVMDVFRNLEAHNIEANEQVYGTVIDGLLRRHGNTDAARAVLHHMVSKGIRVSPHVYTSLMNHHFNHNEFEAIDALWQQIQKSETVVDIVFYDRMIERYAGLADVDKMLGFLRPMSRAGLTPGWPALQMVVTRLADNGDWDRFEEIVNDVEHGVGVAKPGLRVSTDNVVQRFWKTVAAKRLQKPQPWELNFAQARQGGD